MTTSTALQQTVRQRSDRPAHLAILGGLLLVAAAVLLCNLEVAPAAALACFAAGTVVACAAAGVLLRRRD